MPKTAKPKDWRIEWRQQCRRQLARDISTRLRYGFVRTYKPVLDDAPYRIFNTMAEYREWCEKHLPKYLGYGPASASQKGRSDQRIAAAIRAWKKRVGR